MTDSAQPKEKTGFLNFLNDAGTGGNHTISHSALLREGKIDNYFYSTCNCQVLAVITEEDTRHVIRGSKGKPTDYARES